MLVSLAFSLRGQPQRKAFEVVSFKLEPPIHGDDSRLVNFTENPGRVDYLHISLENLLGMAYRMSGNRITGLPRWSQTALYTLHATYPPEWPKTDIKEMLRTLLEDRLQFEAHTQEKQVRGFGLEVSGRGSKLRPSDAEPPGPTIDGAKLQAQFDRKRGNIVSSRISIEQLAGILSYILDQPVANGSKLDGWFSVQLRWTPETADPSAVPAGDKYPSIFTALEEQLGLRLKAQQVATKYLIVDRVEREPNDQ